MSNSSKEFHRPDNWPEAHSLLNRSDVHTVPFTVSPRPTALNDIDADAFVDLEKLQSSTIKISEDGSVHIGALTTLQDLYLSEQVKAMAGGVLSEAAYLSATLGLRNLATIAGAITNPENPPDVPLVLMALEAVVTVQQSQDQSRQVSLQDWMKDCAAALQSGEVILEVSFPDPSGKSAALERVSRTPRDKAIVAAAAVLKLENGICSQIGVTLAGANPTTVKLEQIEDLLKGKAFSDDLLEQAAGLAAKQAEPLADYRGSAEYRSAMAVVLVRRALQQAAKSSSGKGN
jgi:carbon-monoxide dehydrogenase medium subunit